MIKQEPDNIVDGVTLVISSLECGGAEKVLKNMSDYWVQQGRPITVITLFSKELDFFELDNNVTRIDLGLTNKQFSLIVSCCHFVKIAGKLRRAIKKSNNPSVVSFICRTNILTLLVTRFMSVKVIVTEHTDPRQRNLGRIIDYMRKILYPKAVAVVVLTSNVKSEWGDRFLEPGKVKVIPNAIVTSIDVNSESIRLPDRYIVNMGRLIPDKGHKLLVDSFANLASNFPDLSLVIVGDGPEKEKLRNMIESYGLAERIILLGSVHDIYPVLENAECFVLPSLREGFCLALAEAMSCAVVPVSFDCPSGPAEIIRDGVDGILVPTGDTDALASAISELLNDPGRKKQMGLLAAEGINNRFSVSIIMRQWDNLLDSCMEEQS